MSASRRTFSICNYVLLAPWLLAGKIAALAQGISVMPFQEPPRPPLPEAIPAFPGAQGSGMFTTGGRGVWERAHGLNASGPGDGAADPDQDGYTNLEEWLNGTDPRQFIDYKDLKNNVDTISG